MKVVNLNVQKHLFYHALRILKDAGWRDPDKITEDRIAIEAFWGNDKTNVRMLIANRVHGLHPLVLKGSRGNMKAVEKYNLYLVSHVRQLIKTAKGLVKEGAPVKLEVYQPLFTQATLIV